jgi:formylglycine-generating enzyme required for sulfatase activity
MKNRRRTAVALFFGGTLPLFSQSTATVDFKSQVAPVLEKNCVSCHGQGSHVTLTSRQDLLAEKVITPGQPDKSPLYIAVTQGSMPPGQKLSTSDIQLVRRWIADGAAWPADVSLRAPAAQGPATSAVNSASGAPDAREMAEVQKIRERILASTKNSAGTKQYKLTVPNTTISYDMVAIPAGTFTMGSAVKKDEAPPHKVAVPAFWMQAHEVTWDEYRLFMFANQAGEVTNKDNLVDAVSRPTRPYVEMSFGMGINGFPAISMTQHAANKYAEWLSAKTGEFYRLPTEAEWEYACRAGSASAPSPLGDYAWTSADSGGKYKKVGTKKPNQWGLFDMLGNVMEWTLDQYEPYKAGDQTDPWVKPTQPYPIAVRGGSWNDPPSAVTCTVRVASDASWKEQDPQLPKSIWYETDAQWLGFRLIRPAQVPSAQDMYKYWNNGVEHDEQ